VRPDSAFCSSRYQREARILSLQCARECAGRTREITVPFKASALPACAAIDVDPFETASAQINTRDWRGAYFRE